MYHNRLRVDDYYKLFNKLSIDIMFHEEILDQMAYENIRKGFPLDNQFVAYDHKKLSISSLRIVGKFHNKA